MTECTHQTYKNGHYATRAQALRKMKTGEIAWMGRIIEKCKNCSADITWAAIVPIQTPEETMKSHGFAFQGGKK